MSEFKDIALAPNGKPANENFRDWFGDSVASSNGVPLLLFHGTDRQFEYFDMNSSLDGAHFFTTDQEHAESFGAAKSFYVAIQNPLEISDDDLYCEWDKEHPSGEQDDRYLLPRHFVKLFVARAKELGHDALIVRDMGDRDINTDMYLPFHPGQIKSAVDNVGLYDRHSWDFTDKNPGLVSVEAPSVSAKKSRASI